MRKLKGQQGKMKEDVDNEDKEYVAGRDISTIIVNHTTKVSAVAVG